MVTHITKLLTTTLSLVGFTSITTLLCLPASAANNASVNTTILVNTACGMTATTNAAHSAVLTNGSEKTGIGTTTIAVTCNDAAGFAVYAVGYANTTLGNNNLVGTHSNIPTGTGTASSNWGMKLASVNSARPIAIESDYSDYGIVPDEFTLVAHRDAATDPNGAASSITTTYRAYVSPTQAADVYHGVVRYVLVHPSTVSPVFSFDDAFLAAGKEKVTANDGKQYYAMQDMTTDICSRILAFDDEAKLVDTRDGKVYFVTKAKDGKCWMTQNLDLDITIPSYAEDNDPSTTYIALNSNNTDLNVYTETGPYSEASGYSYEDDVIKWTPNAATYKNDTTTGSITNNNNYNNPRSWSLTVNNKDIYQKGTTFTSATCKYFTDTNCVGADKTFNTEPFAENGMHGHLGNYYNWTAAIATNDSSSLAENTHTNIAETPNNSICPKGWRLTRSASDASYNDFAYLRAQYSNSNTYMLYSPLWLVRAGNIDSGSLGRSGDYGYYWSSTVNSASRAYYLGIGSGYFYPSGSDGRYYGFSVRCAAR